MRSSRCASGTASALHRIFIAPLEHSHSRPYALHPPVFNTPPHPRLQTRSYKWKVAEKPTTAEKSRLPRDDEITSPTISLVDASGSLLPPQSTAAVLARLDRANATLAVVVPENPETFAPPICRIFNKQALRESERARLKAATKGGSVTTKTMELNWAIGEGDLGHRMKKLRGWLEKGWKVEVVLAGKRKGRQASEEEAERLLGLLRGLVAEVGGRETKQMEGKLRVGEGKGVGSVTLFVQGKSVRGQAAGGDKAAEGEEEDTDHDNEDVDDGEEREGNTRRRRKRWQTDEEVADSGA